MWIRFTQGFSQNYCKPMIQNAFKNMIAGFGRASSLVQLNMPPVARSLNGGIAGQYLPPCRHIFHLDSEVKVLTPMRWEKYVTMFAECGMVVYEVVNTVWVEKEAGSGHNFESKYCYSGTGEF